MSPLARKPGPRPGPFLAAASTVALALGACAPKPADVHQTRLDSLIAAAIGDPSTCVLLADPATGKEVYRYGDVFNCERALPACDASGTTINAHQALKFAAAGRLASCPSLPDGSRTVGWAAGQVQGAKRPLIYSAVMEGQRALPGHEINARLYDAFQKAGL